MNLLADVFSRLKTPLVLTLLIFAGFEFTRFTGIDEAVFGIHPMDLSRIYGILTVPLVHGNLQHLMGNLFAFAGLSSLLFVVYYPIAHRVMALLWVITGMLMFLFARQGFYHIGASGVVYALIFFLAAAGIISRKRSPLIIAFLVIFYYGGSIWGIFPLEKKVSWDGHLSGAVCGILVAWIERKNIHRLFPAQSHPEWYHDHDEEEPDPYEPFGER